MSVRVVAIVPMRHDSERVPGKNYRFFAGKPLYHHIVNSLMASGAIDEIVIDTDSSTIIEDANENFRGITIVERPPHLRAGTISMNEVLLNTTSLVDSNLYLQTHSTNPLLQPATIARAVSAFQESPEHDSLFSVTRRHVRLYDANGEAINHDPSVLVRTQDLPPVYEENSCLYIFPREILLARRNRVGECPLLFQISQLEAIDIDEESDFVLAEALFSSVSLGS